MQFFDNMMQNFRGLNVNDNQINQAASQYGTNIGSQQSKMLAQQDMAFDQNTTGSIHGGFDMKSMASSLGKAAQAQAGKQRDNMAQMQTTPGQQIPMPGQMPQMPAAPQAPQGPSNAMQMIQGFQQSPIGGGMIGGQPTRQQMMQRLQGR